MTLRTAGTDPFELEGTPDIRRLVAVLRGENETLRAANVTLASVVLTRAPLCGQCGLRWSDLSNCGFTHSAIRTALYGTGAAELLEGRRAG